MNVDGDGDGDDRPSPDTDNMPAIALAALVKRRDSSTSVQLVCSVVDGRSEAAKFA